MVTTSGTGLETLSKAIAQANDTKRWNLRDMSKYPAFQRTLDNALQDDSLLDTVRNGAPTEAHVAAAFPALSGAAATTNLESMLALYEKADRAAAKVIEKHINFTDAPDRLDQITGRLRRRSSARAAMSCTNSYSAALT